MAAPLEITLRNMRFHVCVGVLPHESEHAQPLEIDLTVWCPMPTDGSAGVDYRTLYAVVTAVVAASPHWYLETIAHRVVTGALALTPVTGARAAVRKPHVALGGPLDAAEIVFEDGVRA